VAYFLDHGAYANIRLVITTKIKLWRWRGGIPSLV